MPRLSEQPMRSSAVRAHLVSYFGEEAGFRDMRAITLHKERSALHAEQVCGRVHDPVSKGSMTSEETSSRPVVEELPDQASAYSGPMPAPPPTAHSTIEMETVRVDPQADARRMATIPSLYRVSRAKEVSRKSSRRWVLIATASVLSLCLVGVLLAAGGARRKVEDRQVPARAVTLPALQPQPAPTSTAEANQRTTAIPILSSRPPVEKPKTRPKRPPKPVAPLSPVPEY